MGDSAGDTGGEVSAAGGGMFHNEEFQQANMYDKFSPKNQGQQQHSF
jgi:hypothetical protein